MPELVSENMDTFILHPTQPDRDSKPFSACFWTPCIMAYIYFNLISVLHNFSSQLRIFTWEYEMTTDMKYELSRYLLHDLILAWPDLMGIKVRICVKTLIRCRSVWDRDTRGFNWLLPPPDSMTDYQGYIKYPLQNILWYNTFLTFNNFLKY